MNMLLEVPFCSNGFNETHVVGHCRGYTGMSRVFSSLVASGEGG